MSGAKLLSEPMLCRKLEPSKTVNEIWIEIQLLYQKCEKCRVQSVGRFVLASLSWYVFYIVMYFYGAVVNVTSIIWAASNDIEMVDMLVLRIVSLFLNTQIL